MAQGPAKDVEDALMLMARRLAVHAAKEPSLLVEVRHGHTGHAIGLSNAIAEDADPGDSSSLRDLFETLSAALDARYAAHE